MKYLDEALNNDKSIKNMFEFCFQICAPEQYIWIKKINNLLNQNQSSTPPSKQTAPC